MAAAAVDVTPCVVDNSSFFGTGEGECEYLTSNRWPTKSNQSGHGTTNWPRWGKQLRKDKGRTVMAGVEVRDLVAPHPLEGQRGLFATRAFQAFDIIGEYIGVVDGDVGGSGDYLACLERDEPDYLALGLDAEKAGNEARFINHYEGILEPSTGAPTTPNLKMSGAYVDTLPRVMLIVKRDIAAGDELLLDYGKGYTNSHFSKDPEGIRAK